MKQAAEDVRPLHVLIPTELHEEVRLMAKERDRSVAAETRRALEARVKEFKKEPVDA